MTFAEEYTAYINEHMDLGDRETLKSVSYLQEAEKQKVLTSLTAKLYDKIVDKVDDIDFGTIPQSRGDITKIENYNQMIECLDLIRDIVRQYGQSTRPLDVIYDAINNMTVLKQQFQMAYNLNIELPIVIYNTIALSIVSGISYMITGCIEYVKTPDGTFEVTLDKIAYRNSEKNLLYRNLGDFNKCCATGEMKRVIDECNHKNVKRLTGAEVGMIVFSVSTLVALMKNIIPFLQNLVYFFFHARQTISDYFAVQADLLQMNAANVIYRDTVGKDKEKIAAKQMKIADRFRKVSNFFAVKYKKAEYDGSRNAKEDNNYRYKNDELNDNNDSQDPLF